MPMVFKRTEVMLCMRVVGAVEIIELSSPLDQRLRGNIQLFQQLVDASRYYSDPRHVWIATQECIVLLSNQLNRW